MDEIMSLKEVQTWLLQEIRDLDNQRKHARHCGHTDLDVELVKARVQLVAKLADVRIKLALPC